VAKDVYVFTIGSSIVTKNGKPTDYGPKGYGAPYSSAEGNTMVPLRMFGEELGYEIIWGQADKSITFVGADGKVIAVIKLGDSNIYDEGGKVIGQLIDAAGNPTAPTTGADERTYLPMRALLENILGVPRDDIVWNGADKTITVYIDK